MKTVYIRCNKVDPDPRVEKEINSLIKDSSNKFIVLAWDRGDKYKINKEKLRLHNGEIDIIRYGIPASWGGGIKANLFPMLKFQMSIIKWLITNRNGYDCIHICDLPTALVATIPKVMFKKKMIYDIYDYYPDLRLRSKYIYKLLKWLEKKVIGNADATIICSEKRKEQINGSNPKKLEIIHNTPLQANIDLSDKKIMKQNPNKIKIAYIGCLIEDRYIDKLVKKVVSMDEVELHIGGFGVLEEYVKEMAKNQANIEFYGTVPYAKTLSIENNCDIMIALYDPNILNHKYAAPNKFYEALMLGKPLVMIKNTGMDDVVSKYDIGEVIDLSKVDFDYGFQMALERLIDRKEEWNNMSDRMKNLYQEKFSWDIMERRLLKVYKEVANKNK